jgi:hypothetical protein
MSEFTEADRANVLSTFNKIIMEEKDKFHAYHDLYHVLKDSCDCKVPDCKILPEQEDLLHFLQKKMADHECHGLVHERLVKVVENLPAADTIPSTGLEAISVISLLTPNITMTFIVVVMF